MPGSRKGCKPWKRPLNRTLRKQLLCPKQSEALLKTSSMTKAENYINERLDHLGIVAGVCQEIGLAAWLDAQDRQSPTSECGDGNSRDDSEWIGLQQSAIVFGAAVLREQTR